MRPAPIPISLRISSTMPSMRTNISVAVSRGVQLSQSISVNFTSSPCNRGLLNPLHKIARAGIHPDPLALLHGAVGIGEWLILGCALSWTAYTFIGRSATKTLSPLGATLWASLIGALLLGLTAVTQGGTHLADWSWRVWGSVVFLAIGGTALAFTWFADGVKRLGAARASVFVNLVPVFAVLQAAVLLNERLDLAVLAGGLLVIAGVWLTSYQKEKRT